MVRSACSNCIIRAMVPELEKNKGYYFYRTISWMTFIFNISPGCRKSKLYEFSNLRISKYVTSRRYEFRAVGF